MELNKTCTKCGKVQDEENTSIVRDRKEEGELYSSCKGCVSKRVRQYNRDNPEKYMYIAARTRAKRGGYPFTIKESDIEIPEYCPIFGIPLVMGVGQPTNNSPSLDKIIPELGYVPDNIVVISHRANSIKRDATPEELRLLADFYGT